MRLIVCLFLFGLGGWPASGFSVENSAISIRDKNDTALKSGAEVLIVGGVQAGPNEFPWLVNMIIDRAFCAGSLIDLDLVLTAAHCVVDVDSGKVVAAKKIKVTAGDHNRLLAEGTEQSLTAIGVKIHESYKYWNGDDSPNDIALVRLSTKFNKTRYVSSIGLPTFNSSGIECQSGSGIAAGWGSTREGGTVTDILRKVQVPIDTSDFCVKQKTDNRTQFCAGLQGKDSCQGDSGGPFICTNTPSTVSGIVSYGYGCGKQDYPGVYTRVSMFVPWIKKNYNFSSSSDIISSKLLVALSVTFVMFSRFKRHSC